MAYNKEGCNHEQAVADILDILSNHNLWLKPEKWELLRSKVK